MEVIVLAAEYLDRSKSGRLSVTTSDTFAVTEEFVHLTFKTYKVQTCSRFSFKVRTTISAAGRVVWTLKLDCKPPNMVGDDIITFVFFSPLNPSVNKLRIHSKGGYNVLQYSQYLTTTAQTDHGQLRPTTEAEV
jgi:hypothetical protein